MREFAPEPPGWVQLHKVLAAPLLTRFYGPKEFGPLALIGAISDPRYELAIPLPEDDGEALPTSPR